jgi:hypothetical protein
MFSKFDALGEKTLNKIAEIALSSQLEKVEQLTVQIKTDPNRLAKGILESLEIRGQGLVMSRWLRMQKLEMILFAIAVNPFKAIMGNIQLTQPSQGNSRFFFQETDIVGAIDLSKLQKQLSQTRIRLDGQQVTVKIGSVNCQLLVDQKLQIKINFEFQEIEETRWVSLIIKPTLCAIKHAITLDDYEISPDSDRHLSSLVVPIVLAQTLHFLNLEDFKIEGFSLILTRIDINEIKIGQLLLEAKVNMTCFPTKSLV